MKPASQAAALRNKAASAVDASSASPLSASPLSVPPVPPSDPPSRTRPLFRREVLEFQQHSRQWGRVVPLQPLSTRLLVWSVIGATGLVIAFLFLAQYARKEVAQGYLAPIAGTARVFAPIPGTISAVYVHQGERVTSGQPLLAVDTSQFTADGQDVNMTNLQTLNQQKLALTRAIAEEVQRTQSERQRLTADIQQHQAILQDLAKQAEVQRTRITILEKMVQAGAQLRAEGLVSEVDQRRREEALLEQQQAMIALDQQSAQKRSQLTDMMYQLEQLPFVQGDKIQALRNELVADEQRIAEVTSRDAYLVRAPVAGRISLLRASAGGRADPKRLQLQIVPEDSPLEAELFIPVRAIGFVEVGQDVRLLFDAFPYQRFGASHGRITAVSQTVLLPADADAPVDLKEPAYTATVALDRGSIRANGRTVPLRPDMSLRADIILEKRTLVDWLLAPLRHLRIDG